MIPQILQISRPRLGRRKAARRLRVEHLEARHLLNGSPVTLTDDAFDLDQNGPQVTLDVLANDTFDDEYGGPQLITSVSYGSEGGRISIAEDRHSILYTPPADFFGTETFVYAVDAQYTAQVQVSLQAPLAFDHYEIPPDGVEHELAVLANDPFWTDYQGPRRITAVSVGSAGGTVAIAPGGESVLYTPPDMVFGKETFIYVVDDIYPAQVTIEIPKTLENDTYEIIQHAPPQTLDVLANDPFWPNYPGEGLITHVIGGQRGTVEIASDGRAIIYSPDDDAIGWDSFRYVVDGNYEANVRVRIHRPVRDDSFEVDRNSTDFFYNVTANDWYRDLNRVVRDVIDRVTSVTQSESGGTVVIAAGAQGIIYTPPEGFSGSDRFTYLADGVHEATVYVQVTRPVRNDTISNGVYQDTPDGVLDVLANDFIGNGYAGPRLITAVGPTENGGVLTIRGDGKAILYTPAPGHTGFDHFTYTVDGDLEAEVTVNVRPLATRDSFRFAPDPAHGPYTLNVLQNDFFRYGYPGPGVITAAELIVGVGNVSIQDGDALLFEPAMSGSYSIRYTVDDKYEATVSVWFANFLDPDQFVVDQNAPAQELGVMMNDFTPDPSYVRFKSQDYPGARLITSATQSQHGGLVTVAPDGRSVYYTPPEDFSGEDRFTYTVDGFMTTTATVEVIRRVRDDQFRVDAEDGQQRLPVLVNDLFGANYAGPGHITAVTATSADGTATIAPDGRSVLYTPPEGFVGTDTFTYTVDGALKAEVSVVVDAPATDQFPTFASLEEYTQFLVDDALVRYEYLFGRIAYSFFGGPEFDTFGASPNSDRSHSETNVQVAGVDEGDIVEFDSDYVYMLTDDEVVIVDAWPAEELSIASRIDIEGRTIAEFLHGDRLTVISEVGGGYSLLLRPGGGLIDDFIGSSLAPLPVLPFSTIVTVLDVSDRTAPTIVQTTTMEGKYIDSRGVGDFVYVLVNNSNAVGPPPEVIDDDGDPATLDRYETVEEYLARVTANPGQFVEAALPNYSAYDADGELVRTGLLNSPEAIYRPLVPGATNLISVVSFDIEGNEPGLADTSAVYSTGASVIYASLENFYVFDTEYSPEDGAVTRIAKFDWEPATGGVEFAATTTVAGTILNQFSADENGPYLRIATTVANNRAGNWSGREENTLFVLEEDDGVFEFVGSLQNLALDERMRSVRFLGDRAFVSTFREVDPLFAVDLSDPARPEAVGHITLPGFTSYMHLVDANHLLTVGRNTPGGSSGPTQVALFDITELTQPLRIAEYTFERFTTSEAEIDHHAFGYFAEHGLLGMPVSRVYYERVDEDGDGYREARRTVREHELAVFTVDVMASESGERLALAGQIEHGTLVRRSGYIGDKLYSIASDSVKVVDVSAPDVVISELVIDVGEEVELPQAVIEFETSGVLVAIPADAFSAASTDRTLTAAIDRARSQLAEQVGTEAGAPLLVSVEAAPDAPGGGFFLVFRVGDDQYLYRASQQGAVAFVQSDFEFSVDEGSPWHAVEFAIAPPPMGIPGDFNLDGRVDRQDHTTWKESFGTTSLVRFHPADGNGDGIVDAGDYTVWRDNLGTLAGDYNGDGAVNRDDYAFWKSNFGATSGPGLAADGNRNGVVDAADYGVWRDRMAATSASSAAGTRHEPIDPAAWSAAAESTSGAAAIVPEPNDVAPERVAALAADMADAAFARRDLFFPPKEFAAKPRRPAPGQAIASRLITSSAGRSLPDASLLLLARDNVSSAEARSEPNPLVSDLGRPADDRAAEREPAVDAAFAVGWSLTSLKILHQAL